MSKPVTCDSAEYRQTFYGILNAQGFFWTPLTFDSEASAGRHIDDFWKDNRSRATFKAGAKVVPVRIELTLIEDPK